MKKLFVFATVAMFTFAVMAQEPKRSESRAKAKNERAAKTAKAEGSKEHKGCAQKCAHKSEGNKSCAHAEKKDGCPKAAGGEKKEGCQKAASGEKKSGCSSSCAHKKAAQKR
ncbi:MAG: hypothetical protein FWE63_03805 [Bacteroidales bacterium]|nr:hypothetical protein [Bacteroidales bacterium]